MTDNQTIHIVPVCEKEIEIIYQDNDILVINKPEFLLSMPGKHPRNKDSVISRLRNHWPGAELVHRLDLDTSGIMVIPLNKKTTAHIARQFQDRLVMKSYCAIVYGHVEQDQGDISLPLARDWSRPVLQKVCHEKGKPSVTRYKVIERDYVNDSTRLALIPETGRRHQLRLHCQAIGHPILGCDLYAHDKALSMSGRLLLHAESISFQHPVTNRQLDFSSPCPF